DEHRHRADSLDGLAEQVPHGRRDGRVVRVEQHSVFLEVSGKVDLPRALEWQRKKRAQRIPTVVYRIQVRIVHVEKQVASGLFEDSANEFALRKSAAWHFGIVSDVLEPETPSKAVSGLAGTPGRPQNGLFGERQWEQRMQLHAVNRRVA